MIMTDELQIIHTLTVADLKIVNLINFLKTSLYENSTYSPVLLLPFTKLC